METILRKIYPQIKVLTNQDFQNFHVTVIKIFLVYAESVIYFSLIDVYEIANKIKQSFGEFLW